MGAGLSLSMIFRRMLWALVIIVAIVTAWYLYEGNWDRQLFRAAPGRVCVNLNAQQAKDWLQAHPETQVLDVRSAAEFSEGALPKAIHISLGDAEFQQKISALDKTKPVLVYCAGGYRSRKAVAKLKELGFENIQHIHRGYLSWQSDKPSS